MILERSTGKEYSRRWASPEATVARYELTGSVTYRNFSTMSKGLRDSWKHTTELGNQACLALRRIRNQQIRLRVMLATKVETSML